MTVDEAIREAIRLLRAAIDLIPFDKAQAPIVVSDKDKCVSITMRS